MTLKPKAMVIKQIFMIDVKHVVTDYRLGLLSESSQVLTLKLRETKIAEFANCIDLDEVAHNEPPNTDLPCLPSCL